MAGRRVRVLADNLTPMIPPGASVLDIGCGDGAVGSAIAIRRPDISLMGVEVLIRPQTRIPATPFDGLTLPFPDRAIDVALLVDVVHHASDPRRLLVEAARVAATAVIVKDHYLRGLFAGPTLALMDRIGNARHGVATPFHYWTPNQWRDAFMLMNATVRAERTSLGLYPPPARWIFERSMHFVALLSVGERAL
ncbi:MAG: class I SAM-dependent methyltransferase [Candidatus Dormibacteria bacterium]